MAEQAKPEAGTILVIDDDRMVLRTLRGILEGAGYRVIEREEGGEGTEVFRDQHDEIDAVIMDWIMPGLDGDEWTRMMLKIDPDARIIFCTGYEIDEITYSRIEDKIVGFLHKPFGPQQVLATVQRALSAGQAGDAKPAED